MMAPRITDEARAALRREAAAILEVAEAELGSLLAPLLEAGPARFASALGDAADKVTWASGLLALSAVPGCVRPRLLERFDESAAYRALLARARAVYGDDGALDLEPLLREVATHVPLPADLSETERLLDVAYAGRAPSSLVSILGQLAPGEDVLIDGISCLDGVAAARAVLDRGGIKLGRRLVRSGQLLPTLTQLCLDDGAGSAEQVRIAPLRHLARLDPIAHALIEYCAPRPLPTWDTFRSVVYQAARLAEAAGWRGAPTLLPDPVLLASIMVDTEVASRFDECLVADAARHATRLGETDELAPSAASRVATAYVMRGFQPFLGYLERAERQGATITTLPRGLATPRRGAWQSAGDDRSPPPETWRTFLALLPELVADEALGRLVIIQCLAGLRANVVLALDRSCVIEEPEGLVLFLPWQVNKVGRGLGFIPRHFANLFGIEPSWFPPTAAPAPPEHARRALTACLERTYARFTERTGVPIVGTPAKLTRPALFQLMREHLTGRDREAITAHAGHTSPKMRASYLQARAEEIARFRARSTLRPPRSERVDD